jgi:hypothetical protein
VCLRDLARALGVTPLALHRWEGEGLPVLHYRPWTAYDEERATAWVGNRTLRDDERMTAEQAREPGLLVLRAVAAGQSAEDEAEAILWALGMTCVSEPSRVDPLWESDWMARRPAERIENASHYGLASPTASSLGVPENAVVREIRDICRRLGLSPFDIIRWTHEGMPAVRKSPFIWWDESHLARWVADTGLMPDREYDDPKRIFDCLDRFVIGCVARGEASPEDARDILTSRHGVM